MRRLGRALAVVLIAFLLSAQVSATPTVWRCYFHDGGWRHLNGKAHCELEGWRWWVGSWTTIF